ncbi:MAG: hypothetical protein PHP57_09905 [Sideroxydans sp.]|nr:hypothetical protein [Sideroxydans sp.]
MKKIALSLAGVLAAAAFAPEASAIPSFARQTGMACSSCHFQKFPVLNGFGRAFKAAGYTMMGAQEKVEGEHLSIPGVLNASTLFKFRYQKTDAPATAGAGVTAATGAADGQWQMGDETSLFFGGRIAETEHFTIGFLNENNMAGGNAANGMLAGLRVPVNVDLGAAKVHVVPFTTDALGAAYGFELSSGGVMRANRWAENRRATSAIQYNADRGSDAGQAAGFAFVVENEMGFINLTKWSSSFAPGANGGGVPSTNFGQSYVRVAATPNIAGFDIVTGFGVESGSSYGNVAGARVEANQTTFDFQAHGVVADMEAGVYAQYANAPACTTAAAADCAHNTGALARKAASLGGEVTVIPHVLTLGAAYRDARTGGRTNNVNQAFTVTAVYDLVQNVALHADYTSYSGSDATKTGGTKSEFLGMLEMAW